MHIPCTEKTSSADLHKILENNPDNRLRKVENDLYSRIGDPTGEYFLVFALVGMLVLVALFIQKELISTSEDSRLRRLSRAMNVGILPLLLAFFLIVSYKIVEALN